MHAAQSTGISNGLAVKSVGLNAPVRRRSWSIPFRDCVGDGSEKCSAPVVLRRRGVILPVVRNQLSSDYGVGSPDVDEYLGSNGQESDLLPKEDASHFDSGSEAVGLNVVPADQVHSQDVKKELIMLSLPALAGQAIDPMAQLMETAYIGRLGAVELGSAGVSMSIFNIISKLFNIPLLSVATSFVAEDFSKHTAEYAESGGHGESANGKPAFKRKQLSSVSTALLLSVGIGIIEAMALYFGSGQFLSLMGLSSASPMRSLAERFLSLRAIGAPAVVVSLALQGIFRGFKDTKTPVFCLGVGNAIAVFLFPLLMYGLKLGVTGAAISTVLSQYIVAILMIWYLNKRVILLPPKMGALQFGGYLKSGGFLLGRTLAVLTTMTIGTSMAARQGPLAMAAHQICMQVWLAVSLLTDALAASAQGGYKASSLARLWDPFEMAVAVRFNELVIAVIATSLSKGDYNTVKVVTGFVLKIGLFTGISLAAILSFSFGSLATLFTRDAEVLEIIRTGVLFVAASQPLNALAYIFDGLHYGVSDFPYAARSMMLVGAISSTFLLYIPSLTGLPGVWLGLALFMGLRMAAGYFRLSSKTGPWWFLHRDLKPFEMADQSGWDNSVSRSHAAS